MPQPAIVPVPEIAALRAAWARNPRDLGVGLYNPGTGEIHIGSFDDTGGVGHDGLAKLLGITNEAEWRGFTVCPNGDWYPISHFNLPDGSLYMAPDAAAEVEQALRYAALIP